MADAKSTLLTVSRPVQAVFRAQTGTGVPQETTVRPTLVSSGLVIQPIDTPENFLGGKIYGYRHNRLSLSGDQIILDIVTGNVIELEVFPAQDDFPWPLIFPQTDKHALDAAMWEVIDCRVVEKCNVLDTNSAFYSNIFPVIEDNG